MVKRTVREKEIVEVLQAAGFREVKESDKNTAWYKKASKQTSCLKTARKDNSNR